MAALRKPAKAATPYAAALRALEGAEGKVVVELGSSSVALTHLDKVFWPANPKLELPAYTRRDFMRYLLVAGSYMLPHVRDRPLTLIRMPEGIRGRRFVQFHWEQRLPEFVETLSIYSGHRRAQALVHHDLPHIVARSAEIAREIGSHMAAERRVEGVQAINFPASRLQPNDGAFLRADFGKRLVDYSDVR